MFIAAAWYAVSAFFVCFVHIDSKSLLKRSFLMYNNGKTLRKHCWKGGPMDSVLIISSTDKGKDFVRELLLPSGLSDIAAADTRAEAKQFLKETAFDLIVINSPLADEFGHELALHLAGTTDAGIVFIVKEQLVEELSGRLENDGVFVIGKPVNRQFFSQMLRFLAAARRRTLGIKNENLRLQKKIDEMKLIDRAKFTLMQYLSLSEPQANRYMEKQAMDLRLTKKQIALDILKTYKI